MTQASHQIIGLKNFRLEEDKITRRQRGLDQLVQVWQRDRYDAFANGGAPPNFPNMRILEDEITVEVPGQAYVHRLQCSGIAGHNPTKVLEMAEKITAGGWDEATVGFATREPDSITLGSVHPDYPAMFAVDIDRSLIDKPFYNLQCAYKGIIGVEADKPRKRRITVNNQVLSSSTTLALTPGNTPFYDEFGNFTGWQDQRFTALDTSRIILIESFVSSTVPPTDRIPGHWTPENPPEVFDIFDMPWYSSAGFTFNWPWGWKLSGVESEQIPGVSLWLISLTFEYVPRAVIR
jgi:hypothetical protein